MRLFALPLIGALVLTACSERDMCLNQATRELRVISKLVDTTRGNLQRGYAIGTREVMRERRSRCTVTQPDGSKITQICTRVVPITKRFPVAIDLNAERRKLDSLEERQRQVAARAGAAQQSCLARYPE